MKLDSLDYIIPVSYSHYCPLGSPGSDFETGREPFSFDNQGMVPCCRKRIGQAPVDSLAIVMDGRGFAVDRQASSYLAAVSVGNALMS